MKVIEHLRVWWQERTGEEETPFDGDAPAWFISTMFHVVALVLLAVFLLVHTNNQITLTVESVQPEDEIVEPEEFFHSEQDTQEIGANSLNASAAALALAPNFSEISEIQNEMKVDDVKTAELQVNLNVASAPNVAESVAVKGAAGVGTTGASGAIDRITHEILLSLESRKTLVVWLFDKSGSLRAQREQIHGRFDRIYRELGVIEESGNERFTKHGDEPLLSAVAAFGQQMDFLTENPTGDIAEVKAALEKIQDDPTGVENVFQTVLAAVGKYKDYRIPGQMAGGMRNVMFVIVSDEVGDDALHADKAIATCRRWEIPVYIIGVPAPFGRKDALVKYVDPDPQYNQDVQWIPVTQGPESVMPERLRLFLPGSDGRPDDDMERLDSGFGPFDLTRLSYETGGIYFAVHPNRSNAERTVSRDETSVMSARLSRFFDPTIMRRYRPDYVSREEYQRLLLSNKARYALVQAAQLSSATQLREPQLRFSTTNEANFKNGLTEAQKQSAILEPVLLSMYNTLKMGEKDRKKLTEPRWQAGFDLAMGRVLAARARTEGYNQVLAKLKNGRRFKGETADGEANNVWIVVPSNEEIEGDSQIKRMVDEATVYLQRVADEHEGTPWGLLAAEELKTPMGWSLEEDYQAPRRPGMGGNGNGNPNPPADQVMKLQKPKPKRQNIKL